MKRFTHSFVNWTLTQDDRLMLTHVDTHGTDLDDFLCNASISIEDWHGNAMDGWNLEDLSKRDHDAVVELFVEYLNQESDLD